MTGYESKRSAARDKLLDDDDTLTIAYATGYYDGKKATQPAQEPFGYFRYDARLDAWVQNCGNNQGTPFYTTPPQRTEQEPVAYLCKPDQHGLFNPPTPDKACKDCFPIYRQSPQRPWVGLTDEEVLQIRENLQVVEGISLLENLTKAIEAKLKEKNNAA